MSFEQGEVPDVDIKRIIGSGCFGVVMQGEYRGSHKKCALKRIQKVGNQLSRQYQILGMIKNLDNVVQMEQLFYTKNEVENKLIQNIIFQYVESNLQSLIQQTTKSKSFIKQISIKRYIYQLLNGLKNIHQFKIAHRDLKPQNVLLSDKGEIKICDFGSSKIIDQNGKNTPYIVSRYYRAPQLILCLTRYSTAIDIWAVGCILAELYKLQPFFKGKTEGQQIYAIVTRMGRMSKSDKEYFAKRVPYDVSLLNNFDVHNKQDFKKTFEKSKDIDNLIDILNCLLEYNPEQRISAKEALDHPYFDQIRDEFVKKDRK